MEKGAIEGFIGEDYQQQKVVFTRGMSGLTVSVQSDGIVAYLCRIRRMPLITKPLIEMHNGGLVKFEADHLLAVFDPVADAHRATLEMIWVAQQQEVEEERKDPSV